MPALVQLSDPHLTRPGERVEGRIDTAAAWRRALRAVARLPQRPDALLVSGDLVERGEAAEYRHFCALLRAQRGLAGLPVLLLPGNHDDATRLAELCRAELEGFTGVLQIAQGERPACLDLPGLRLIGLDSRVPGAGHGALAAAALAALAALLEAAPQRRTLLALHHPPFELGLEGMDTFALHEGRAALAALLQRHAQVERVVCGHLHRAITLQWAGRTLCVAPSTAHQLHLDFAPGAPLAHVQEPGGLLLHRWPATADGQDAPGALLSLVLPLSRRGGPQAYA